MKNKKSIAQTMEELAKALGDSPEKPGIFLIAWGDDFRAPCVRLRVELMMTARKMRFDVRVDFSLPQGAEPDNANKYAIWSREAADKSLIAQQIVKDRTWSMEEGSKYYNEES